MQNGLLGTRPVRLAWACMCPLWLVSCHGVQNVGIKLDKGAFQITKSSSTGALPDNRRGGNRLVSVACGKLGLWTFCWCEDLTAIFVMLCRSLMVQGLWVGLSRRSESLQPQLLKTVQQQVKPFPPIWMLWYPLFVCDWVRDPLSLQWYSWVLSYPEVHLHVFLFASGNVYARQAAFLL